MSGLELAGRAIAVLLCLTGLLGLWLDMRAREKRRAQP